MQLRILGCSGGIGGDLRTTSMLLDNDTLIDAGTGVGDLSINELAQIDHIFVTHSHLDHVATIPFIVDTVGWMRDRPLTVHATAETLAILQAHLFNWKLWPDFSQIPDTKNPVMRYEAVALGGTVVLNGRRITPLPANHVVPAVGYHFDSGRASLVFTGDTTTNDALWPIVNEIANLQLPDHRNRILRPRTGTGALVEASLPQPARRGTREVEAHARDLYHAFEAGRVRTHHAADCSHGERAQAAHAAERSGVRVLKGTQSPGMRRSNDKSPRTDVQQGYTR